MLDDGRVGACFSSDVPWRFYPYDQFYYGFFLLERHGQDQKDLVTVAFYFGWPPSELKALSNVEIRSWARLIREVRKK